MNKKSAIPDNLSAIYFNIAEVMLVVINADQTVDRINKKGCNVLGYKEKDIIGRNWFDNFLPENNRKEVEAVFNNLIKGEASPVEYYENPVLTKSGEERTIAWHNAVLKDDSGMICCTISSGEDITERKAAEDLIRQAKYDWEDIFDSLTEIITIHDKDFNIIRYNKAAEKFLGLPLLKNVHVKCFKFYHGTDSPPEDCPSCQCIKTKEPLTFESFESYLNMFVEITSIPRFDKDNQFSGLIHVVRDITERKKADEQLRLHGKIVANMLEGVSLARAGDLEIVYANPRFEKMFGYDPGELIGENISVTYAHGVRSPENVAAEISAAIKRNAEWKGELKNIRKDGSLFWSHVTVTHFDHPVHGKVLLSVQSDITGSKRIHEEILSVSKFPSENPNPVLRINRDKDILYMNESFTKLLTLAGLAEKDAVKILPKNLNELVDIALEVGKPHIMIETQVADKIISYNFIPIKEHGYVNLYGRDITDRKKYEKELKKRVKELEGFYNMAVGREVKMKELKKEIKELKEKLSKHEKV